MSFIFFILALGGSAYSFANVPSNVSPPASFGKATNINVGRSGNLTVVEATNARGDLYRGTYWNNGRYHAYRDEYHRFVDRDAFVNSGSTGAKSTNTINASIRQGVSKREVISKVFANGKGIGGKVLLRGLPYVGQAALAWDLVNAVATDNGYNWSDDYRNWVKPTDGQLSFFMRTSDPIAFRRGQAHTYRDLENWCNKPSSSGGSRDCSIPQATTLKGELLGKAKLSLCGSFKIGDEVVAADHLDAHGYCAKGIYFVRWGVVSGPLIDKFIPLTEDEFVRIAEPTADSAPSTWVKAAKPETLNWSKPEVLVQNGMAAQSSPYTNAQGQAGQTRWTFNTPQGATSSTANEEFVLRPDLKPNSPTAPALAQPSTPQTNTPASAPATSADDKRQPPAESDLCDKYPNILACDELHDANDKDAELEIPKKEIKLEFEKEEVFDEHGRCPEPVRFNFSYMGFSRQFGFSLEYVCEVGRRLRPILIALAWVIAAMFAIRTVRANA